MTFDLVLVAWATLGVSAALAALAGRSDRGSLRLGTAGALLASALGLAAAARALALGERSSWRVAWAIPLGELHFGIDPLSAFFLVCVFTVAGLAALYGAGYLKAYLGRQRLAPAVAGYNLLVASMVAVVLARDGIVLLVAWELMSLSSYFLVTFEHDRAEVRRAGMTYLVASHLSVLFLFVLFALLGRGEASYDFDVLARGGAAQAGIANAAFLLALLGFGTKAGIWPLHLWLPDAHPAAPSHVSALMSGAMIKMGIYGLLRTLQFLGPPPAWWGGVLIAIGAVSGVLGVLQALAQHDLKRLLAYHSVENIGIIALGVGIGLLGQSAGVPAVAFLGYAGALLHTLNHGLFKGLLFQGAGSVLHGAGTTDVGALGGLHRSMPTTSLAFLIGAAAICGLPPLNGFVSEWLILVGALRAGADLPPGWALSSLAAVLALALIAGLAAACFVKAYGVVFLGTPRVPLPARAHDPGPSMRVAMMLGAALCLVIGAWPIGALWLVTPAARFASRGAGDVADAGGALAGITAVALILLGVSGLLALLRAGLLRRRPVAEAATWGCGYAAPTARMQYTAASFAQPVLAPFEPLLYSRVDAEPPRGYFPAAARREEHVGDMAGERILLPAYRRAVHALGRVRVLQQGRVQVYLGYILATLILLLVWQLGGAQGR